MIVPALLSGWACARLWAVSILIRLAEAGDVDTVARFNAAMAWETEHLKLDAARLRAGVDGLLADPSRGFYLLAMVDGKVAGQLMITFEWSDWRSGVFWWIQSVYVDPAQRQRGIFKKLYQEVEQLAAERGEVCGIRLYVEKDNSQAQGVYERLGMKKTSYEVFELDYVIKR